MTGDLAGLITALGLEQPIIGGHSLGANYAARVAACHPDLVCGLILVDPAWYQLPPGVSDEPRPPSDDDAPPGESSYDRWLVRMGSLPEEEAVEALREQAAREGLQKDDAALLRWALALRSFDTNFFTTDDISQTHFPEITGMIRCPTLLITGECARGAIVGQAQAKWIVEQNSLFEVVKVARAGHNIPDDNFGDFIQAVQAFLARYQK